MSALGGLRHDQQQVFRRCGKPSEAFEVTRNTTTGVEAAGSARRKPSRRSAEQRRKGADRMRLSRRRKRLKLHCFLVELHDDEISALVSKGYLQRERCADRGAVLGAFYAFMDQNLR